MAMWALSCPSLEVCKGKLPIYQDLLKKECARFLKQRLPQVTWQGVTGTEVQDSSPLLRVETEARQTEDTARGSPNHFR